MVILLFFRHLRSAEVFDIVSLRDGFEYGFIALCFRKAIKRRQHQRTASLNPVRRSGRSPALPYPPYGESVFIVFDMKVVFNPSLPSLHE
jgi:hypothetical protein